MSGFAFWDTNLFVYWMEEHPDWGSAVNTLADWQTEAGIETVTSSLTLGELLVHPLRSGEVKLAQTYARLLTEMECLHFGPDEAWRFAELRCQHPNLRPPDAIQLACASIFGVQHFVTNDNRLSRLKVEGIGQIWGLPEWQKEFGSSSPA